MVRFYENENLNVIKSSVLSSVATSLCTNALEVIVIRKQAESGENVLDIFR